jgi:hypothetical protein
MLGWILERTKMASLAGKWADATSLDPGDRGQTAVMASALMKQTGMRAEDAWVTSLCMWMENHPDPEASYVIALAMIRFLNIYEHSVGLSPEIREVSRLVAEGVIDNRTQDAVLATMVHQPVPVSAPAIQKEPLTPPPVPVSAQESLMPMTAITAFTDSDFVPTYVMSKSYAYERALPILVSSLKKEGYALQWVGKSRADTPSLIAEKDNSVFFILLDASVYPRTPHAAPFMIQRCVEAAKVEKAKVRLAHITLFNAEAYTDAEKSDISRGKLGWSSKGLEKI